MQDQSFEQLQSTLTLYQTQLAQIRELSAQNPDNASYNKLLSDLTDAIKLTENLLELKKEEAGKQPVEIKEDHEVDTSKPLFEQGEYIYGLYEGLWYVGKVTKVVLNDDAGVSDNLTAGSDQNSTTAITTTEETTSASDENKKEKQFIDYYVKYVGYGNSAILNYEKKNIRKYVDPPTQYITPGTKCYAVYDQDEKFYEAVIDTVTDHGSVWVTFLGYKNIQEVTLPNIRLINRSEIYVPKYIPKQDKSKKQAESDTSTTTSTASGKRKDPPASSETQEPPKKKKRKKSAVTKAEIELNSRQNSWQNFLNKGGSKKQSSMFRSPQSLSGKVGVIGSDKPMTQNPNQYKPKKSTMNSSSNRNQ